MIGRLKALADKHRVCMLIVHHTRKQGASDKLDAVSGTNGINGSADGSLIMEKPVRTGLEATINITGRDHQDQILYLKKDPVTQIWNLERVENELYREPPDPVLEAVAKLVTVEQPVWTGSPSELAEAIHSELAVNALTKYLNIRCGKLTEEYHVRYENKAKHSGRRVTLMYLPPETHQVATVATVATVIETVSQQPSLSLRYPSPHPPSPSKNPQILRWMVRENPVDFL